MMSEFKKNIVITERGDRVEVECRLGLWGVTAPTEQQALSEAYHYFVQYEEDGEYDGTLLEKLSK